MNKHNWGIVVIGILACVFMTIVETVIKPGYFLKSVIKVFVFLVPVLLYALIKKVNLFELLNIKKMKEPKSLVLFVLLAYFVIVISFFIFKGRMDLLSIKNSLVDKEHLTKQNCLFVFAYIIFCNSFIEETFFRGFLFRGLMENKKIAYIISGLLFASYHIGIVGTWFHPVLTVICILGLMIAGMVLTFISEHYDSLLASYLVHGTSNLAINTIGLYLIFML